MHGVHDPGTEMTKHLEANAIHLGDGAYAAFDGFNFWVWADRENGRHAVALEPLAIEALNKFMRRLASELTSGGK
jgi:hypothetical protein